MRATFIRRSVSYLLIAGAAVCLFLGGREFLGSRFGQMESAREFDSEYETRGPVTLPQARTPERPSPLPGETIGKLLIPRLKAEIYVVEGEGEAELRKGPGHLPQSANPGEDGNCVIAGHRDTHFRVLKDIRKGDDIAIETRDGLFLYRVKSTRIVAPTNLSPLKPTKDGYLNLITCYPFYYVGNAPKRFIVEAKLAGTVARTS
jgi:sortase A